MWSRKKLTELNSIEFYQILKLRIDTFVVEQERIYHELDEKDLEAVHVYHANEQGKLMLMLGSLKREGIWSLVEWLQPSLHEDRA